MCCWDIKPHAYSLTKFWRIMEHEGKLLMRWHINKFNTMIVQFSPDTASRSCNSIQHFSHQDTFTIKNLFPRPREAINIEMSYLHQWQCINMDKTVSMLCPSEFIAPIIQKKCKIQRFNIAWISKFLTGQDDKFSQVQIRGVAEDNSEKNSPISQQTHCVPY